MVLIFTLFYALHYYGFLRLNVDMFNKLKKVKYTMLQQNQESKSY